MEPSDEVLMMAYQHGEVSALETLVRRHADSLLGYLVRMMRNRQQAEDLFQDTFIRVHEKARSFRATGRFKSWLFAIATRLAFDQLRKHKRYPVVHFQNGPEESALQIEKIEDPGPLPSQSAATSEQAGLVRAALDELPPRQKATLILAYYEGLSYPEVAGLMRCSVGTVKTQMSRALRTLARKLPDIRPEFAKGGAA